jgi:hypothetical protein
MLDNADPLHGWSSKEVEDCSAGPATADIYGKLFYHVRAMVRAFVVRLSSSQVTFRLFQMDATDLAKNHLESNSESFDRIEVRSFLSHPMTRSSSLRQTLIHFPKVSNISDGGYLGIHRTLAFTVPFLQSPLVNPHATLITLFMNAVDENITDEDRVADMVQNSPTKKRLLKYLPLKGMPTSRFDPELIKFTVALDSVATHDHIFDR